MDVGYRCESSTRERKEPILGRSNRAHGLDTSISAAPAVWRTVLGHGAPLKTLKKFFHFASRWQTEGIQQLLDLSLREVRPFGGHLRGVWGRSGARRDVVRRRAHGFSRESSGLPVAAAAAAAAAARTAAAANDNSSVAVCAVGGIVPVMLLTSM